MNFKSKNSFQSLDKLEVSGKTYHFYNLSKAEKLINQIKDHIFGIKIGYEFFFNFGLKGYKKIQNKKYY